MNTSLTNIQGITVTVSETTESITGMIIMVAEITLTDRITITITMEYECCNGEDPIMLNLELMLNLNHNLPQGGSTNWGTFNKQVHKSQVTVSQLMLTIESKITSTGSTVIEIPGDINLLYFYLASFRLLFDFLP